MLSIQNRCLYFLIDSLLILYACDKVNMVFIRHLFSQTTLILWFTWSIASVHNSMVFGMSLLNFVVINSVFILRLLFLKLISCTRRGEKRGAVWFPQFDCYLVWSPLQSLFSLLDQVSSHIVTPVGSVYTFMHMHISA